MPEDYLQRTLKKAKTIGPDVNSPQAKSTSKPGIKPGLGTLVPNEDRGTPLTAASIPELLARYGLDPTDPGNIGGGPASGIEHAISIYATKEARDLATKEFLNAAAKSGNEALINAAHWFAERWPRVAAHMNLNAEPIANYTGSGAGSVHAHIQTPVGQVYERMPVEFTEEGLKAMSPESGNTPFRLGQIARNTLAHEGTHAAQALGNSDFNNLYSAANEVTGYHYNPFEVTARARGTSAETLHNQAMPEMMRGPFSKQEANIVNELDDPYGLGSSGPSRKYYLMDQAHKLGQIAEDNRVPQTSTNLLNYAAAKGRAYGQVVPPPLGYTNDLLIKAQEKSGAKKIANQVKLRQALTDRYGNPLGPAKPKP